MENYIRENYPKYKIISSTTKRILGHDAFLEELNKDYYQVCLDYDLNHDMELLNHPSYYCREQRSILHIASSILNDQSLPLVLLDGSNRRE